MIKLCFRLKDGNKNFCRLYLPHKDAKNIPVIIYCHGWTHRLLGGGRIVGGSPKVLRDYAIKNGMAFLAFDNYGEWRTRGSNRYFSHARWGEGVNAVYDYIIQSGLSHSGMIGCFGISSGTTAAFRMEQKENKLAFIVSVATCISNNIISMGGPKQFYLDNKKLLDSGKTIKYCQKKVSKIFFDDDKDNLCIDNMDKIQCPVLFLQGSKDNERRKKDALDGYEILNNLGKQTEHYVVEGGNHGLTRHGIICAEKTITFIKKVLNI